jgi:hypothetical protein
MAIKKGSIVILVLVFGSIFLILISGTVGFIFSQHKAQIKKALKEEAMQIAEAGVNYYKWHLAHFPNDLQDGTGGAGPYEHEYFDPEGGAIGKFSLEIDGQSQCDNITAVDIISTGWTYKDSSLKRTVKTRYSRPSVAEFAYIIDDNVWAGSDREIKGRYHSNGGIRMDGENDSLVTSAKETWNCTSSFGCNPPYEVKPGIFGDGEGQGKGLWSFPAEPVDFIGLSVDLTQMKSAAQNFGVYFPPPKDIGYPSGKGYHVIFQNNGTFDVYVITDLSPVYGYHLEGENLIGEWEYQVIDNEVFYQNYQIPSGCGLIFFEDDLWVEGTVQGKTTIVSGDLINPNEDTDVWIAGNIDYTTLDGTDGLLVVGENNILIPLYSPDNMELRGIFMAQKGHFGRNLYTCSYSPYDQRSNLEINGSIVSKGRVGTKWGYWAWWCGGSTWSGYNNRENSYDRKLMTDPPPLTPYSDDEYNFVKWEEK